MISLDVNSKPDKNWNKRLIDSGLGTIQQVAEMGTIFESRKHKPIYFQFLDSKGNIVGQLLAETFQRFDNKGIAGKILKNIPKIKKKVFVWISGPVIFKPDYSSDIYSTLGEFFTSQNAFVSGITHPLLPGNAQVLSNRFRVIKWVTSLIDLEKPIDELYENIDKHSGRKNIQRAIKRGVIVEEINEKSIGDYNKLLNETKNENYPEEKLRDWWKLLQPFGYSVFIAKKDGIPIGGLGFSYLNNFIVESGVARSKIDIEEKLYAQDLIKWKIIEWGVKNKMKYYNLVGFNPNPISKKEIGIKRYKEKWGGKTVYYWIIKNVHE